MKKYKDTKRAAARKQATQLEHTQSISDSEWYLKNLHDDTVQCCLFFSVITLFVFGWLIVPIVVDLIK